MSEDGEPDRSRAAVYRIADLPVEQLAGGTVELRALRSESTMVALVVMSPGAAPGTYPVHRHPFDQLVIVEAGVLSVEIDGSEHRIPAGAAIVIPAGSWHTGYVTGSEPARFLEILTPVRRDYLHLTSRQAESFADTSGASWFADESDRRRTAARS